MLSCFCVVHCAICFCMSSCKKRTVWFMVFHVDDVLWGIRQTLKHNIFVENIMFALYLILGLGFIDSATIFYSSSSSSSNFAQAAFTWYCVLCGALFPLANESLTDYKIIPLNLKIYHDFYGRVN